MGSEEVNFGRFRLDLSRRELLRDEVRVRIHRRPLGILCALAEAKGEIVSKDELIVRLWPGRAVEEINVHVHVSALRKALDERGEGHSYVVTVPGRGYRLADLTDLRSAQVADGPPPQLPLLGEPSTAASPRHNMNGATEQEYVPDGIVKGIRFGRFRLDLDRRELLRDGEPLRLHHRALGILCVLAEAKGNIVSKDELLARLWAGRAVEEANIHVHVSALRRALDEHGGGQSLVVTVPGRGYRLADMTGLRWAQSAEGSLPPLPDKPSIAVLAFTNLGGDAEQQAFADGIAEDIITCLARYPSLFVIARNSSFAYKDRAVDTRRIGHELGVRYILEGSLRKFGDRIRVNAQLVEAETGRHVWAERYDKDFADVFLVQDNITQAATIAIAPAVASAERQRAMRSPPGKFDAWAAYQRGLWHFCKGSQEENAVAQRYFQQSADIDPNFAGGYKGLAWTHIHAAGVFAVANPADAYSLAEPLARRAIALDPTDAEARATLSETLLWSRGDYEGALGEAEQALQMSPNLAFAHAALGAALIFSGRRKDGISALQLSLRLDPYGPTRPSRLNLLALGLFLCNEYEGAVEVAKRAIRSNPDYPLTYRWLAAALGQLRRTSEAKDALEKAVAMAPVSFAMYVRGVPWHRQEDHVHMIAGLRNAGWIAEA